MNNSTKEPYQLASEDVLAELQSSREQGLSSSMVEERLRQYGLNELIDRGSKSPWKILLEQLSGIMTIILIISAIVSFYLGDMEDSIAILAIVILNTILGFSQEYRAEKAMLALKKMAVPSVKVRRNGEIVEIKALNLVPGDLVLLEAGNTIPADGRILESINLKIQESVLTGESEAVEKTAHPLEREGLSLGDRKNMVYMGTIATYGRGLYLVTQTGMQTELGKIADMLQSVQHDSTPLQKRLEQLARGLAAAALAIVAIVFAMGLFRGEDIKLMFLTAISMAVAAVPEGLPTVVTIALALGAQRMLKRNALIRKLPAVETLGSVTYICSDKTGTLTQNKMTVTTLDVAENKLEMDEILEGFSPTISEDEANNAPKSWISAIELLLTGGAICNDATLEASQESAGRLSAVGDPTEGALVIAAARYGLWQNKLDAELPRFAEIPFDSERKRMSTVHHYVDDRSLRGLNDFISKHPHPEHQPDLMMTKGAVDQLLDVSTAVWVTDHLEPLTEVWIDRITEANNELAEKGKRVLGVGVRWIGSPELEEAHHNPIILEKDLIFVGMFGMIDPIRPEAKAAVSIARAAGIKPVMITGDHPITAMTIANELGMSHGEKAISGIELQAMSVEDLENIVDNQAVYARVSPEHKLKIVQALQERGQIVAMTGDGVNDAPALKKADIGVAMGITGTDVSKEAADMVLLDDNFATIVAAVEEGRRIYDNIRKFIKYALASNSGELWVMLLGPILGMPMPLLPLQILWINLVTDGLPGLALTVEPAERNVMKRMPFDPKESIFRRGLGKHIIWVGILMGLVCLLPGYMEWKAGNSAWQTVIFTTLTLSQMGHVLAVRSGKDSLFKVGLFSNKPLFYAVLLTLLLQLAVIYVPFLQAIFETENLTFENLVFSLALSTIVFFAVETEKWISRRRDTI